MCVHLRTGRAHDPHRNTRSTNQRLRPQQGWGTHRQPETRGLPNFRQRQAPRSPILFARRREVCSVATAAEYRTGSLHKPLFAGDWARTHHGHLDRRAQHRFRGPKPFPPASDGSRRPHAGRRVSRYLFVEERPLGAPDLYYGPRPPPCRHQALPARHSDVPSDAGKKSLRSPAPKTGW